MWIFPPYDNKSEKIKQPEPILEPKQFDPVYTVGITEDSRTTLTLKSATTSCTLSMTKDGVRQLIRLLESTIIEPGVE